MRPGQHRDPERGGFEQIVASDGHQAAADERHIGRRIQSGEFANRVHEQHLRPQVRRFAAAAPRESKLQAAQEIGHRLKSTRMPRHEQQEGIGPTHQ